MYVLLVGTVVDGVNVVGPFPDESLAIKYAEIHERSEQWQIAPVIDSVRVDEFLTEEVWYGTNG